MWRLAVDLGEASIGWGAFRLDPTGVEAVGLMDGGVRLFSNARNPKDNQPLNIDRRTARGMRRNADRRRMRARSVEAWLVQTELLSGFDHQVAHLNPYQSRAEAAGQAVQAQVLARAMLHLAKARGFKSNRKTDKQADKKAEGDFDKRLTALQSELAGRTLGQWLYARQQAEIAQARAAKANGTAFHHRKGLRFRSEDNFHPLRAMLETEFDTIQATQAEHHDLSADDWTELRRRVFHQRPLKLQERGKCTLYPTLDRALKALPTAEAFRIEQQLSNLRYRLADQSERALTPAQRDLVRAELYKAKTKSFSAMLKLKGPDKQVLFPGAIGFNLETKANKSMAGASTWIALQSVLGSETPAMMSVEERDKLVERLIESDDTDELIAWLRGEGLDMAAAEALADLTFQSGTTSLCLYAMRELLDWLKSGLRYDDAVKELKDDQGQALHHSVLAAKRLAPGQELPYYGALLPSAVIGGRPDLADPIKDAEGYYGRIMNPTVHVALNQLRRVVNSLIRRYGHPAQLHIELAREIGQGPKARSEALSQQAKNRKKNEALDKIAREAGCANPRRDDRIKVELWEMGGVSRQCVFTGRQISTTQLFNGETEIEHLLPYGRTLDDRRSNKVVVFKSANAVKGARTPFEAFSDDHYAESLGIRWAEVLERAKRLPAAWSWRFGPDAMERFFKDGKNLFVERSLNDTRYLARIAKKYLEAVTAQPVVVVTGQHTSNLRHDWRLNALLHPADADEDVKKTKNRGDHRHHLIDAFVIGLTTRGALQSMAQDAKRSDIDGRQKRGHSPLAPALRTQLQDLLDVVNVSVKPDRSANGQFFNETAYGVVTPLEGMEPERTLATRVNVVGIRKDPEGQFGVRALKGICDPAIRSALDLHLTQAAGQGIAEKDALKTFLNGPLVDMIEARQIKRLRVFIKNQSAFQVPSASFKAYAIGAYAFVDIWHLPKNARQKSDKYVGVFVDLPTADAVLGGKPLPNHLNLNHPDAPNHHPAARRTMRLFKNDVIEVQTQTGSELQRVFGFSATDNRIDVRLLNTGAAARAFKGINQLGKMGFRKVNIEPDGSIRGGNR